MRWFFRLPIQTRVVLVSASVLAVGLALGLTLDANAHIPKPWNRVSSILGWTYFLCWAIGFYPQLYLNYTRQSVVGLSLDFMVLHMLGFICYTIFNCAFYFSTSVQEQYMRRNGGNRNAVEANDVLFSVHATFAVTLSIVQCLIYTRGEQTVSRATVGWTAAFVAVGVLFEAIVVVRGNNEASVFNTLNFLYYLSYVKLVTTLVKNIPQIVLNYQLKSTAGWTIWGVFTDIAGGVLSVSQQLLDGVATHDWTAITGDPVKFSLGLICIHVDVVFLLQHYVWYAKTSSTKYAALQETQSLLPIATTSTSGSTSNGRNADAG
ncbi:Lysosomal cystine transporter, partial [Globisporangium splendens]